MQRIRADEYLKTSFFKVPKVLFYSPKYKHIPVEIKTFYSILRDRLELSLKYQLVNQVGEIYFTYTRKELMELLNVSEKTITSWFKKLKEFGLLEEERIGLKQPNRLYLAELDTNYEELKDTISRSVESTGQEPQNVQYLGPVESTGQEPQNVQLLSNNIKTDLNNTNIYDHSEDQKMDRSKNKDYDEEFNTFWNNYEKKEDKQQALKKFKEKRKKYSLEIIIAALEKYKEYLRENNTDKKYMKQAKTFLNNIEDYFEEPAAEKEEKKTESIPALINKHSDILNAALRKGA